MVLMTVELPDDVDKIVRVHAANKNISDKRDAVIDMLRAFEQFSKKKFNPPRSVL